MNIPRSKIDANKVSFTGHIRELDKTGYEKHNFFYLFDPTKYTCEVEFYNINKDKNGNYTIQDKKNPAKVIPMGANNISVDMSQIQEIISPEGFAYRFKLTDKNSKEVSYAFDNGMVAGIFDNDKNNKYNVVLNNRAIINKNGAMQLIMPDGYYPGVVNKNSEAVLDRELRNKALTSVRTHANKLGGNFQGIIKRLPEIQKEGIVRIVGTPFTKDSISSHKYWTENVYQISPDFGTEEDYKKLQQELFKNGINWISDAALVNEGLGGIHISEYLRKGDESVSKNMFRFTQRPMLGILPNTSDYTRLKLINSPYEVTDKGELKKNNKYSPLRPTYIQFYDERLVSEEQKKSDKPITTYDKKNTDNVYDITKHDDAVYPYHIEVNPNELIRNLSRIEKQYKSVDLSNNDIIKQVADFSTFGVTTKSENGGVEVWDGNVDIPKLNFYRSTADDKIFLSLPASERQQAIEDFDKGTLAVRDYAINSGKYWTKLTDDIQFSYISQLLAESKANTAQDYMKLIEKEVHKGNLPKIAIDKAYKNCIDEEIIQNVLNDEYHLKRLDDADMRNPINPEGYGNSYTVKDYILRNAMDVPLETLPFANNLLGIITSPYIEKKASTEDELGVSRYDIYKAGNPNLSEKYRNVYEQTEEIYENQITPIITQILEGVLGDKGKGQFEADEYDKYVISEMVPDLTRYIITKAIAPESDIQFKNNGQIDFSHVDADEITMQSLGIPFNTKTSEEEAQILVNILRKGISEIPESDKKMLTEQMKKRFENRTLNDFKIAEMIMDRTESGLGWRIDAAKDIASIDAVRSGNDNMTKKTMDNIIDFWKRYNQSVLSINPHAYTTAELTDFGFLFDNDSGQKYTSDADAERKFLEETGITSVANYNYLFMLPTILYSHYNPDDDMKSWMAEKSMNFELLSKLDTGWNGTNPGFLFQSPDDGVIGSYTFSDNHDKPRIAHQFALDMYLYNTIPLTPKLIEEKRRIINDLNAKQKAGEQLSGDEEYQMSKNKEALERDMNLKTIASEVLMKPVNEIDFGKVSAKAIAMGYRLNHAIDETVKDDAINLRLKDAVSNLAEGEYKGKKFDSEAFGTRDFETAIKNVFDEAELQGKIADRNTYEIKMLNNILVPAFDRMQSVAKLLTILPGSPTDFAGARTGSSGYETKAKNYNQQNRNIIHWEYLDNPEYEFILDHYKAMNDISNLRSRKELSALNDGATITLPGINEHVQALLRYNDDSEVITVLDSSGSSDNNEKVMNRNKKYYGNELSDEKGNPIIDKTNNQKLCDGSIDRIILNDDAIKRGLKHGLYVGSKFKNARSEDKSVYIVMKDSKGNYYLQRQVVDSQNRPSNIPIKIEPEDKNALILYRV